MPFSRNSEIERSSHVTDKISLFLSTEAFVAESRGEFYPELYLKAGLDYLQNSRVVEQTMAAATVGIKVNLFDGMATTSRQRQAVKLLEKEKERLSGMEEGFLLEINTAGNDIDVAAERIADTRAAIRQSEENLRINDVRLGFCLRPVGTECW